MIPSAVEGAAMDIRPSPRLFYVPLGVCTVESLPRTSYLGWRTAMPTSYPDIALERALDEAIHRLGPSAGSEQIEREALRLLGAPSPSATHAASSYRMSTGTPPIRHVSVSAARCASRRPSTQRARLYDLLRRMALQAAGVDSDLPPTDGGLHLHVRDTSLLLVGHPPSMLDVLADVFAHILRDTPTSWIHGPFLDLALEENAPFLDRLSDLIPAHPALCPILQAGTLENGWSEWILDGMAWAIATALERGSKGQVIVSVNDCDRRAWGHRVHMDTVVVHGMNNADLAPLPVNWMGVSSADLSIHPMSPPIREIDTVRMLQRGSTPDILGQLMRSELKDALHRGIRKQVLLVLP